MGSPIRFKNGTKSRISRASKPDIFNRYSARNRSHHPGRLSSFIVTPSASRLFTTTMRPSSTTPPLGRRDTLADGSRPPPHCRLRDGRFFNLSYVLNYAVSGLHVWSYHAFNLLVHILGGLTLFRNYPAHLFSPRFQCPLWRASHETGPGDCASMDRPSAPNRVRYLYFPAG